MSEIITIWAALLVVGISLILGNLTRRIRNIEAYLANKIIQEEEQNKGE